MQALGSGIKKWSISKWSSYSNGKALCILSNKSKKLTIMSFDLENATIIATIWKVGLSIEN